MSVFREAFVELGEAAFAEAKALGEAFEAAIAEAARQRVVTQDALHAKITHRPPEILLKLLVEHVRPAWKFLGVELDAFDRRTIIRVQLPCLHKGEILLDERAFVLARGKEEICDYVVARVGHPPHRRCYCVGVL